MPEANTLTILCLASYEKGAEFMRQCKRQGCRVILLTIEKLAAAGWPHESIDEIITVPDMGDRQAVVHAVSHLARTRIVDRIVALEDYDVETAAALREHLRCPGMGATTARYFRDKLAMRAQALDKGFLVPDFVHAINYERLREFTERVPPPWVLKPRSEAATVGIRKVWGAEELWPILDSLGDRQSYYLLEKYVQGNVYHMDAIVSERETVFAEVHRYGEPPMKVAHEGGLFTSRTLPRDSEDARTLRALHQALVGAFGFVRGITHTEFIKGDGDGLFYFLETAPRVGGAYIVEMVEAGTGINLWGEWAKIEVAGGELPYWLPELREDYAGIIISLARQEYPDTSAYVEPEIVWRLNQRYHAGLVVASPDPERVAQLLDHYSRRFYEDFFATAPLPDKPAS